MPNLSRENAILLAILAMCASARFSTCSAEQNKELYELQEKCGRRAQEVFQKAWGDGNLTVEGGSQLAYYENHYSRKLNACFMRLKVISDFHGKRGSPPKSMTELSITDVNENRVIGFFQDYGDNNGGIDCSFDGTKCNSKAEWEALTKPYMTE